MPQQSHAEFLLDGDGSNLLGLSGKFSRNEGEEVFVLVVDVRVLSYGLLHLVVKLVWVQSENFVVALADFFRVLELSAFLVQLYVS